MKELQPCGLPSTVRNARPHKSLHISYLDYHRKDLEPDWSIQLATAL